MLLTEPLTSCVSRPSAMLTVTVWRWEYSWNTTLLSLRNSTGSFLLLNKSTLSTRGLKTCRKKNKMSTWWPSWGERSNWPGRGRGFRWLRRRRGSWVCGPPWASPPGRRSGTPRPPHHFHYQTQSFSSSSSSPFLSLIFLILFFSPAKPGMIRTVPASRDWVPLTGGSLPSSLDCRQRTTPSPSRTDHPIPAGTETK